MLTKIKHDLISIEPLPHIPQDQHIFITKVGNKELFHYDEKRSLGNYHGEGGRIFLNTNLERLKEFIGSIIKKINKNSTLYKECFYFRNDEKIDDIYATDEPLHLSEKASSYFMGHATCILNVTAPKSNIKLTLITDPVENHINRFFAPRMTPPPRYLEAGPLIDIFLLTHNHLDHYQKNSLQKLVAHQPLVLSPKGNKKDLMKLGFKNVHEFTWWQKITIPVHENSTFSELKITTVPANHWSGKSPFSFNHSAFLGFVIHQAEGDIYFSGDTARLSDTHIQMMKEKFNIIAMFQPGGPDELREDMEITHQSSADALWMHFKLPLRNLYEKESFRNLSKNLFMEKAKHLTTLFMHNKAYKLGNVHFDDTEVSLEKVKKLLKGELCAVCYYENDVYLELITLGKEFIFNDGSFLTAFDILNLIDSSVRVPKLGSRTALLYNSPQEITRDQREVMTG